MFFTHMKLLLKCMSLKVNYRPPKSGRFSAIEFTEQVFKLVLLICYFLTKRLKRSSSSPGSILKVITTLSLS